ncbi:Cerato-platanin-domain-containing protein [Aspergillus californicus]
MMSHSSCACFYSCRSYLRLDVGCRVVQSGYLPRQTAQCAGCPLWYRESSGVRPDPLPVKTRELRNEKDIKALFYPAIPIPSSSQSSPQFLYISYKQTTTTNSNTTTFSHHHNSQSSQLISTHHYNHYKQTTTTTMKFTTTLLALLPAASLTLAAPSTNTPSQLQKIAARQSTGTSTLSYDPKYDVGASSLATTACSDGDYGLLTEGYTTFDSLPSFPRIGGVPTVAGWGSAKCGSCYQVTYTSATGASNSIFVTAVDSGSGGFNVGVQAMNTLTGNRAEELGRVDVTWLEVDRENCGLAPRV